MDLSTAKWLSELEQEAEEDDPSFLQHWVTETICDRPPAAFPASLNIISFGETMDHQVINSETDTGSDFITEKIYRPPVEYSVKGTVNRTPLQAQDHILAERKRRQKLTERFIALSAIVPGLKKLDKASVLGGAIKYLKELEEKQHALETIRTQQYQDSSSKRARPTSPSSYDHTSSSDVDFEGGTDQDGDRLSSLPEIQVRISGHNLLLRIYCCNINGIMNEMLRQIEKLPISVTSSNAMPFGKTTLCVTIIAQVDGDSGMKAQELARDIREVVMKLV